MADNNEIAMQNKHLQLPGSGLLQNSGCKFCMQQKTNISQINFIIHAHLKCHANAVGAKLKQCKTNNIKM